MPHLYLPSCCQNTGFGNNQQNISGNTGNKLGLSSAKLKLATTSSELATNSLGLLTQPALARVGSMGELQLRTYW